MEAKNLHKAFIIVGDTLPDTDETINVLRQAGFKISTVLDEEGLVQQTHFLEQELQKKNEQLLQEKARREQAELALQGVNGGLRERINCDVTGSGVIEQPQDHLETIPAKPEQMLQERGESHLAILDSLPVSIVVLDRYGIIVQVNDSWRKSALRNQANVSTVNGVGLNYLDITRPAAEQGEEYACLCLEGLQSMLDGSRDTFEMEYPCPSPTNVAWYWMRASRLHAANGGVVISHIDITERKRMEQALRMSQQHYQAIVEDQTELICRFLPGGVLTFVNDAYSRFFGKTAAELLGTSYFELIPEEDRPQAKQWLKSITPDQPTLSYEHQVIDKNGNAGWQLWTDRALYNPSGQLIEYQSVGRDITKQKQAELALRQSEERFRVALKNSPIAVSNQDSQLRYTWIYNPVAMIAPDKIVGFTDEDIFPAEEAARLNKIKAFVLKHGIGTREEIGLTMGKKRYFFDLTAEPLKDKSGTTVGVTCATMDITHRKQAETELIAYREHLEELVEARTQELERLNQSLKDEILVREETETELQITNANLQHRLVELSTLNRIAQTVATISNLQQALQRVVETITDLFGASGCQIYLLDTSVQKLDMFAQFKSTENGYIEDLAEVQEVRIDLNLDPIISRAITTGYSVTLVKGQVNGAASLAGNAYLAEKVTALLVVPLVAQGKAIGIIRVYSEKANYKFDLADVSLAETIGSQIAGAIEITRMFDREQERRREADRRRQVAESLEDILINLNSDRPLEEVFGIIINQANKVLGSDANAIYYNAGQDGPYTVLTSRDNLVQVMAQGNNHPGFLALQEAVARRQPVPVVEVLIETDSPTNKMQQGNGNNYGNTFPAILAVPLIINEVASGGILLFYKEARIFTDEEVGLAVIFSHQVALAIENSRLRLEEKQAAIAAERIRLARELHDAVTQTLFSVSAIAEALPRVMERHPVEAMAGLQDLRSLTQGALAEMRTLLLELRPTALLERSLGELLRQLTDSMKARSKTNPTISVVGDRDFSPEVQMALYRIAQEALNNVIKHSRATWVNVGLYCKEERVELLINDNGCGFILNDQQTGQFGLGNMLERAQAIGATLTIDSWPGKGTQVMVTWQDSEGSQDDE